MANGKSAAGKPANKRSGSRSSNGSSASKSRGTAGSSKRSAASASKRSASKAADAVEETAAKAKGPLDKARGPAMAVGAAAAGVAGGMLLKGRLGRKRVLGMPMPRSPHRPRMPDLDVKSIAKSVGEASQTVARKSRTVSRDIERIGEQAERVGAILSPDSASGSRESGRRSPIEVVLDGLTHRRGGD